MAPALLDPGAVDPSWAPPTAPGNSGVGRKTIPAPLLYGSILLVVVLLVVAIWGFGGFKRRTDILKTTPPGTFVHTGPYEFRFTEATAQHEKDFNGTLYWQVVMIGEGRTTGNESISPNYMPNDGMFVSKDDVTPASQPARKRADGRRWLRPAPLHAGPATQLVLGRVQARR